MIDKDKMATRLLEACPNASKAWQDHLESWGDEERGHYNDMAVFAHHIVDSHAAGDTSEFEAFFVILEECIAGADDDVKDLAMLGLIESIQNIASHSDRGYVVFEPWLRPRSREAWREVEAFWEDVMRAKRKGE